MVRLPAVTVNSSPTCYVVQRVELHLPAAEAHVRVRLTRQVEEGFSDTL